VCVCECVCVCVCRCRCRWRGGGGGSTISRLREREESLYLRQARTEILPSFEERDGCDNSDLCNDAACLNNEVGGSNGRSWKWRCVCLCVFVYVCVQARLLVLAKHEHQISENGHTAHTSRRNQVVENDDAVTRSHSRAGDREDLVRVLCLVRNLHRWPREFSRLCKGQPHAL
jgi:hypothetical protein